MTIANRDVSDETLSNWLATSTFKFNPSKALEQIATQKWLHLGFLQIYENWAEYRRTDLPVLDDDRENGTLLNKENAPVRFLYPAKEASMNTEKTITRSLKTIRSVPVCGGIQNKVSPLNIQSLTVWLIIVTFALIITGHTVLCCNHIR